MLSCDRCSASPALAFNTVSVSNELLWTLIGLMLTIGGTFIEAFTTNFPWNWAENGIRVQSLGVTYQIAAVLLTACLGGRNAGALSQIAYVTLGLIWLPIFSQGGGWGYLQQPTFGYIVGFIPGAWLCGYLAFKTRPKLESLAASCLVGLAVIHAAGAVYLVGLSIYSSTIEARSLPLMPMIVAYSLSPLLGQLALICAVAAIAYGLRQILFY